MDPATIRGRTRFLSPVFLMETPFIAPKIFTHEVSDTL